MTAAVIERTRTAVLNVLMLAAVGIALSGGVIRYRDGADVLPDARVVGLALKYALLGVVVASYVAQRLGSSPSVLRDPATRARRFVRARILAAAIAALAVPLGLAYGLLVRPDLREVAPFWVAAVALGLLAFPRGRELDGFDEPLPPSADDAGGPA